MRTAVRFLTCSLVCLLVAGCISEKVARKYDANKSLAAETISRLNSEITCCTSYREIKYQPLESNKRLELLLNPSTPVFDFPFGKSRFLGFQIPTASNVVEVLITAIEMQSGAKPVFRPRVLLLNSSFELIQDQPQLKFDKYFFGATTEGHIARITVQTSQVRYVIITADPDFIGKEYADGGKSYLAPAGGAYVGISVPAQSYPYGYEGKGFIAVKPVAN